MSQQTTYPPQQQKQQPGRETKMRPQPEDKGENYRGSGKLTGQVALITGGDSGIGRAVAIDFAKEGADVAIIYLNEDEDASETKRFVEKEGRRCLLIKGDIGNEQLCRRAIDQVIQTLGHLSILVNHAGEQHVQESIENISSEQLEHTFRTNIFAMFYLTKLALPHLKKGASIINTASVTAYKGKAEMLDYAATKGAIVAFTRSLAQQLVSKGIRVNAVAPGPVWTPLIPASYSDEQIQQFGKSVPMQRAGQPDEMAPSYVFLASSLDSSYMTGQVLHPNGGTIVAS